MSPGRGRAWFSPRLAGLLQKGRCTTGPGAPMPSHLAALLASPRAFTQAGRWGCRWPASKGNHQGRRTTALPSHLRRPPTGSGTSPRDEGRGGTGGPKEISGRGQAHLVVLWARVEAADGETSWPRRLLGLAEAYCDGSGPGHRQRGAVSTRAEVQGQKDLRGDSQLPPPHLVPGGFSRRGFRER